MQISETQETHSAEVQRLESRLHQLQTEKEELSTKYLHKLSGMQSTLDSKDQAFKQKVVEMEL